MDETTEKEPAEAGKPPESDPDIISLPRRFWRIERVLGIFLVLFSLQMLADAFLVSWQISRMTRFPFMMPFLKTAMFFLIIASLSLIFGAICLLFFAGSGRAWTRWSAALLPMYMVYIFLAYYLSEWPEGFWESLPVALVMLSGQFVLIAIGVWIMVNHVPALRAGSAVSESRITRRSLLAICGIAALTFVFDIRGVLEIIQRLSTVSGVLPWRSGLFMLELLGLPFLCFLFLFLVAGRLAGLSAALLSFAILGLKWFAAPEALYSSIIAVMPGAGMLNAAIGYIMIYTYIISLVVIFCSYAFRRFRIGAFAFSILLLLTMLFLKVAYIWVDQGFYQSFWSTWHLLDFIGRLLGIFLDIYLLGMLAIIPLRPLGKELFRRVEK